MPEKLSTQQFLEISQVRDGVMILKNKNWGVTCNKLYLAVVVFGV